MTYLRRIYNDLKAEPIISIVTVIGTALSIFLIMAVVMIQQVKVDPFGPEPYRDRTLYADRIRTYFDPNKYSSSAGNLGVGGAKEFFGDIEGIEKSTIYSQGYPFDMSVKGVLPQKTVVKSTDSEFFEVFALDFIAGAPYDSVQCLEGDKVIVLSRSTAARYFATPSDAIGKEVLLRRVPYRVAGVVEDISPLATQAYAQGWYPVKTNVDLKENYTGGNLIAMVMAEGADTATIRSRVDQRLATINTAAQASNRSYDLMGAPFTHEEFITGIDIGSLPDMNAERRNRLFLYLILLLVPAVNLAGLTQSRLRRRMNEIGVRRAFGASRGSILVDILTENFILTVLAGGIGLLFCLIFAYLLGPIMFADNIALQSEPLVSLNAIFHWSTFGIVMIFCFVLNLLSNGIPALVASRVNPVVALNSQQK